ncbi:endopeptidase La [Candidatus Uhrbacteria bacterium]|nr:endopeptidase La [Candidatus Uhrbacteria bacterium]
MGIADSDKMRSIDSVPVIALRDTVVFPKVGVPIAIRRKVSVAALRESIRRDRLLVFVAQRRETADVPEPEKDGIYSVGTLVQVRDAQSQPDESLRVTFEGIARVRILSVSDSDRGLRAKVRELPIPVFERTERLEARVYGIVNLFRRIVGLGGNVPFDVMMTVMSLNDPWHLGDLVASHIDLRLEDRQAILESEDIQDKLDILYRSMDRQVRLLQMASRLQAETGKELDKMQREMFLREHLHSIERELEEIGARPEDDGLAERLEGAGMPEAVWAKVRKEYGRLKQGHAVGPESGYLRAWLDCLADLPWKTEAVPDIDLRKARAILDSEHFGMAKVKERILEHLAVMKLTGKNRGPILCFVGPPGTGKTSIGRSIAEAVGRKFHRISLGGVRDEAEIRGHRRTYVGALPGRIIQGIQAVGSRSPVFMLDELDKVGSDWRGDPASALLEALDPEQNGTFSDHYLEVPFDLSEVMFIATANTVDSVPPALRDRLEVIEFPGYAEEDKVRIAVRYLIPKVIANCGLKGRRIRFGIGAVRKVIRSYTMEAGVRSLERELTAIGRKLARRLADRNPNRSASQAVSIGEGDVVGYLGPEKITPSVMELDDAVGRVTGLAWTGTGGDILRIEASAMPGKGQLQLTGHLGEVMKESAQAALTCVRSSARSLGFAPPDKDTDIHLHVPAGAIPKDGPSAGAAMATALVSLFSGRPIRRKFGVTGEITLRGDVLEVGGIREKVLAARRSGLKAVVLPEANAKDLSELPIPVRRGMKFILAKRLEDVLKAVLMPKGR